MHNEKSLIVVLDFFSKRTKKSTKMNFETTEVGRCLRIQQKQTRDNCFLDYQSFTQ